MLAQLDGTRLVASSSVYETAAIGGPEQADYLNQVVAMETPLAPHALLDALRRIEDSLGRVRMVRWGARTIDLDLLLYDDGAIDDDELTVPHPRIEERRFVLEPLAEIAPGLRLASGRSAREALALVRGQAVRLHCAGPSHRREAAAGARIHEPRRSAGL
jgi:2-amino-4-hydroxy-6-hydroxymethyldihydropteridine diphosphokinase